MTLLLSSLAEEWDDSFWCQAALGGNCCNSCCEPALEVSGREAVGRVRPRAGTGHSSAALPATSPTATPGAVNGAFNAGSSS